MATAQQGSTVKVHYTGTLKNGEAFDSSRDRDPLEFTIGEGKIIPAFEESTIGMEPGETKSFEIEAKDAYGDRIDELVQVVEREQIPDHLDVQVGRQLQVQLENGQSMVVTIVDENEQQVTLDGNHPLAGEDLKFEIELVDVS